MHLPAPFYQSLQMKCKMHVLHESVQVISEGISDGRIQLQRWCDGGLDWNNADTWQASRLNLMAKIHAWLQGRLQYWPMYIRIHAGIEQAYCNTIPTLSGPGCTESLSTTAVTCSIHWFDRCMMFANDVTHTVQSQANNKNYASLCVWIYYCWHHINCGASQLRSSSTPPAACSV